MTINRRKLATIGALAGALTLAGGLAAAAALPGAADGHANDATTGVTIPSPDDHAGDHPDGRGASNETKTTDPAEAPETEDTIGDEPAVDEADEQETAPDEQDGQGATISSIARDPSLSGREKGAAVSDAASDGKSHAGEEHGKP
jgi:hypothetical protein